MDSRDQESASSGATHSEEEDVTPSSASSWEASARNQQNMLYNLSCDSEWDSYRSKLPSICNLLLTGWCECFEEDGMCPSDAELFLLKRNIGFCLFGRPREMEKIENEFTGYESKQRQIINQIFSKVVENQKHEVLISTVYIVVWRKAASLQVFPVFRIPKTESAKEKGIFLFIDYMGRVYKSWEAFLEDNLLPEGKCCYPTDGVYHLNPENELELSFSVTPFSRLGQRVLRAVDITTPLLGVGAEVGLILMPATAAAVAAPVCVAGSVAAGMYGLARCMYAQADRGLHRQSISLSDKEALKNWISIAGSTVCLGSFAAAKYLTNMARTGKVVPKIGTYVADGLVATSHLINGIGLVDSVCTLKEKIQDKNISPLECFQVGAQCLFFFRSVLNTRSAKCRFENEQIRILDEHKDGLRSNRHRKMFEGIKRETMKNVDAATGRANVIRGINHISNADEFYASVIKSRRSLLKAGIKVGFDESGNLSTKSTSANQQTFFKCPVEGSGQIPFSSENLTSPTHAQAYVSKFSSHLNSWVENLTQYSGGYENLICLLQQFCGSLPGGDFIFEAIKIIFEVKCCRSPQEYINVLIKSAELCHKIYEREISWFIEKFQSYFTGDHHDSTDDSNVDNQDSTVDSNLDDHLREVVKERILTVLLFGLEDYQAKNEEIYHFPTHLSWGENGELSPEEYLLIGQNALGLPNVNSASILQNGLSCKCVHFEGFGVVLITSKVAERCIIIQKIIPVNML